MNTTCKTFSKLNLSFHLLVQVVQAVQPAAQVVHTTLQVQAALVLALVVQAALVPALVVQAALVAQHQGICVQCIVHAHVQIIPAILMKSSLQFKGIMMSILAVMTV